MPSQLAFILHSPFQNVIIRQLWKSVFLACSFTLFFTTDFPIHIFSHIHCTALLTSSFSFFFWFYLLLVLQYLSKKKKFIPSVTTFSIIDVKLQKCKPLIICSVSTFVLVHYFISCHYFVHYVIGMYDMPLPLFVLLTAGGYVLVDLTLGFDSSG